MKRYLFGRGNRNAISVEMMPGHYFKIGVSCVKSGEEIATAVFDRSELFRLSEFFMLLGKEHGQQIGAFKRLPLSPLNMEECEEV